ncbi:anthranilate synthase component I family protein [Pontibacter qinzhouensis]|uniref:Anthranilate synthase component I family protein n=1 Tax=Pontibacter qinzhouensis TaxID=2603253 RepID=A0A5C8K7P9_9BACT|nr:anthranilate synthase component I family protein [Pontibacter qinzhouensis]TXK45789.1 anthranilate synthase component I family protein [Pontibacter qinzhouensis]
MHSTYFPATDLPVSLEEFRRKALGWADQFLLVAYYTSHQIPYPYQGFDHVLAVSAGAPLAIEQGHAFESIRQLLQQQESMWCGYLGYDLKNQVEKLQSQNSDYLEFPEVLFFEAQTRIYFNSDGVTIFCSIDKAAEVVEQIVAVTTPEPAAPQQLQVQQRVSSTEYKAKVERIRQHILQGDVYELNYCIEFFSENVFLNPLGLFLSLSQASPAPFAGYLKYNDKFLLCASPERFLKKTGSKIISQPIKGTIRRGATPQEDAQLQQQLRHDEKELAENMMIMDLVRNDLRKSCATGSVTVEEMFGIYGFRQVSQMITTVTGHLRPECDLVDALTGAFPMGSMTGAPKIKAMQLIEELEETKRGLFSGAFGYITPDKDCDFNVVIRSLQYNARAGYLSFMVGSAITYDSDPQREYEECLLKAKAMLELLSGSPNYKI